MAASQPVRRLVDKSAGQLPRRSCARIGSSARATGAAQAEDITTVRAFRSCRLSTSPRQANTGSTSGSRMLPGMPGRQSAAITAALRFDPEPPQLAFEPMDPADPLRVVVNAVDQHSGVARGEIEMRAAGTTTWHGLATDRQGSLLVAHVDDERFRKGAYEFRAHAVDQAGNEASTGRRADGSAATLRLPARIDTRLAVGVPRTIVRRRIERRHGRRRLVRRRIRRLDSNVIARARSSNSAQWVPCQR